MATISYRRDIDGLRAVAVLLVILSHAKLSSFAGGFIGVDIFFVISGYLITSIIVKEVQNNAFTLSNFYMRRVRRILPALVFLLLLTTIASLFILLPADLVSYSESAFASLTAWSNVFLAKAGGNYWGQNASIMPLGHIWSLAVEEQFYFIWPSLFLAVHLLVPKKYQKWLYIGLFLVLLIVSEAKAYKPKTYYRLSARSFELMIGVLLALYRERIFAWMHRFPSVVVSCLGVGLIAFSVVTLEEHSVFPGINALWPCLGAMLLLVAPKQPNFVVSVLESHPMVFVGRISYSLYLWHWPIFALLTYRGISLEEWRWTAVAATFLLATFSYYFVEQPFRKSTLPAMVLVKRLFIYPTAVVVVFMGVVNISDGLPFRYSASEQKVVTAKEANSRILFGDCFNFVNLEDEKGVTLDNQMCFWGKDNEQKSLASVDVLLIGDSHAQAIRGLVETLTLDAGLTGGVITKSSRPFFPSAEIEQESGRKLNAIEYNANIQSVLPDSNAKYIVLAGRFSAYIYGGNEAGRVVNLLTVEGDQVDNIEQRREELFAAQLEEAVELIIKSNKVPVLLKDVPEFGIDPSRRSVFELIEGDDAASISKKEVYERQQFVDGVIDRLAEKYPTVTVIDPKEVMCDQNICRATLDGIPLYYDDDHLNYFGAKAVGNNLLKKFKNPFTS